MIELKLLQEKVYSVFVEFDRVCRKYDIKYSMEGGTLLGAVKYKGFVPWDDDIDVIMKRDEYERFLKVAPEELRSEFFLQSYNNIDEFPLNYAKLCLEGSMIVDYDYTRLKKMHHGIFMDIFPIDNVCLKNVRKQCSKVGVLTAAKRKKLKVGSRGKGIRKILYGILSAFPLSKLNRMIDKQCKKYNKSNTEYRYEVCNSNKNFPPLPKYFYDEYVELDFNDRKFFAIKNYDEFLKTRFGKDYMTELPPIEKRVPSHNQNIVFIDK